MNQIPENDLKRATEQALLILRSYKHWTGRDLVPEKGSAEETARAVFEAPFVVLSATADRDPVMNYGNRAGLELWEISWDDLMKMPSRLTAEPVERPQREAFLRQVAERGIIEDYRGIRISKTGRRFEIHNAAVWNMIDADGTYHGQAASFREWSYL